MWCGVRTYSTAIHVRTLHEMLTDSNTKPNVTARTHVEIEEADAAHVVEGQGVGGEAQRLAEVRRALDVLEGEAGLATERPQLLLGEVAVPRGQYFRQADRLLAYMWRGQIHRAVEREKKHV